MLYIPGTPPGDFNLVSYAACIAGSDLFNAWIYPVHITLLPRRATPCGALALGPAFAARGVCLNYAPATMAPRSPWFSRLHYHSAVRCCTSLVELRRCALPCCGLVAVWMGLCLCPLLLAVFTLPVVVHAPGRLRSCLPFLPRLALPACRCHTLFPIATFSSAPQQAAATLPLNMAGLDYLRSR